jgi:DNA invertase Pin-like site-specific DNA recombinase
MKYGYARVSTKEQSLDVQIEKLKSLGVDDIFSEKVSGVAKKMPEREKLLKLIKPGDEVSFYKFDRLGRSLADVVLFARQLEEKGATLKSITEGIDTSTPAGKMVSNMLLSFAEYERCLITERTKAGLQNAKDKGIILGRRRKLSKQQVKLLNKLIDEGHNKTYIADMLDISRMSVHRYIDRQVVLVGELTEKGLTKKKIMDKLGISQETVDRYITLVNAKKKEPK